MLRLVTLAAACLSLVVAATTQLEVAGEAESFHVPLSVPHSNVGRMQRFTSAVMAASSLTLLTEFGDKTFFVAAILGAKFSKLTVWWGSSLALWVQTVMCAAIGHLLKRLPSSNSGSWWAAVPWDHYVAGVLLIGFGVWNVYECVQVQDDSEDPELRDRDLEDLLHHLAIDPPAPLLDNCYTNIDSLKLQDSPPTQKHLVPAPAFPRRMSVCSSRHIKAASEIVAKTRGNKAAFLQSFTTVFAAELGDRSMFSTIALAAAQDAYGVALGACMAHSVVCMAAVTCSSLLCRYISERTLGLIAAGLFFLFGVLSILDGILKQTNGISA